VERLVIIPASATEHELYLIIDI